MTAPEQFITCDQCGGEGTIYTAGWAYAPGCGYPHEDVEAHPCTACNGAGGYICEAEGKASEPPEKTAADAPAWYNADEANAWANGYNAAIDDGGQIKVVVP